MVLASLSSMILEVDMNACGGCICDQFGDSHVVVPEFLRVSLPKFSSTLICAHFRVLLQVDCKRCRADPNFCQRFIQTMNP